MSDNVETSDEAGRLVQDLGLQGRRSPSRRTVLTGVAVAVGAFTLRIPSATPAAAAVVGGRPGRPVPFGPATVYAPPPGTPWPGVKYAKVTRVPRSGPGARTLVATFENLFDPVDYAFPVFSSSDDGRTWARVGAIQDAVTGAKPRWQPFIYALPQPFAGLPRGALLAAGNAIPDDFSATSMDVYYSTDAGKQWHFASTVATGGPPIPNNGDTPVWEPCLLLHEGRLICYYSDQRDPLHGQKLAHQTSTDLRTWGPVVNDHADPVYNMRPGMTTVAAMGRGQWIMAWEDGNNTDVSFGVMYKIASDPEHFDGAKPHLLRTRSNIVPIGSPSVTWTPASGRRGTVVLSAGENTELFVNSAGGDPRAWTTQKSVVPRGYSRQVQRWDDTAIMTIGAGPGNNPPPGLNTVQFGLDTLS